MGNVAAGIVAIVLSSPYGLRPPENAASAIGEAEVRAVSAGRYSELLRLSCANGWKFRRSEVVAGFHRHFEELRLVLVDRGATIVPLAYVPELEVTEIFFGLVEPPSNRDRRTCYRARWRKQPPEATPVAN